MFFLVFARKFLVKSEEHRVSVEIGLLWEIYNNVPLIVTARLRDVTRHFKKASRLRDGEHISGRGTYQS
jgi:hypothetical protein